MKTYDQFIAGKIRKQHAHGFAPVLPLNKHLFDWQRVIVEWAVKQGRCALFEECGFGKTLQSLEWARQVVAKTGGRVLILCPLAVAEQTVSEGRKFGISVKHVREPEQMEDGISVTNYERLQKFLCIVDDLEGVYLDESSILKSFMGKTRIELTRAFACTPYRLCGTATPAPNDYMEFGQHAEFLGVMASNEMLSRWFINDTMNFGQYRLKGHARKDFWKWVSTWAACISMPSDIGFPDDGYVLPKLNMQSHCVAVDQIEGREQDELIRSANVNATTMHKEMRLTCQDRVNKCAELVNGSREAWVIWCNTNYEADALKKAMPDAIEVRGSDSPDDKESKLAAFTNGEQSRIITKPSIAGFGLNWQHCRNHAFVGLSYSFEDFYQAMRRGYRFGQKQEFNCHIIQAETEGAILQTVQRKMQQHREMLDEMKFAAASLRNETDKTLTMKTDLTVAKGQGWQLANGDCVRYARDIPDASIHFSVYSPPFANLYIYSADAQDMGNCDDDEVFFEQYKFLIAEKFRITKPGCLTAVHCKNLVAYKGRDGRAGMKDFRGAIISAHEECGWQYHSEHVIWKDPVIEMQRTKAQGLLFKQLRQDSRFSRSGMPEYLVIFRKWGEGMEDGRVEHAEGDAVQWPYVGENPPAMIDDERHREIMLWQKYASPVWMDINQTRVLNGEVARENQDEKHICPLQLDVIDRALWLYTNEGDTVYSPFAGIGSEGYCAVKARRKFIGSELKESYHSMAVGYLKRAESEALDLFSMVRQAIPA